MPRRMRESTDYMRYTCGTVHKIFDELFDSLAKGPLRRCSKSTIEQVKDFILCDGEIEIKNRITYQFRDALNQAIDDAWEIINQKDAEIERLRKQLAQYTKEA